MDDIWTSSDYHLGHKSQARRRGFDSVEEHDEFIIERHNAFVKPHHTFRFMGDLTMEMKLVKMSHYIDRLNGKMEWILGNHDSPHPMHRGWASEMRKAYQFAHIVSTQGSIRAEGTSILLNHFPYSGDHTTVDRHTQWRMPDNGLYLLHGHTHSTELHEAPNSLHVGWEAWGRPVAHSEIMQHFLAWKNGQ